MSPGRSGASRPRRQQPGLPELPASTEQSVGNSWISSWLLVLKALRRISNSILNSSGSRRKDSNKTDTDKILWNSVSERLCQLTRAAVVPEFDEPPPPLVCLALGRMDSRGSAFSFLYVLNPLLFCSGCFFLYHFNCECLSKNTRWVSTANIIHTMYIFFFLFLCDAAIYLLKYYSDVWTIDLFLHWPQFISLSRFSPPSCFI